MSCPGPGKKPGTRCGERIRANGLCVGHDAQRRRDQELAPLRTGPARVKLPGTSLRLAPELAAAFTQEAVAIGLTVSELARHVLEQHATRWRGGSRR